MDTPSASSTRLPLTTQAAAGLMLEDVLENISDAVIVFDQEMCYQYLNPVAERLIGRPAHEFIGRCFSEVFPDLVGSRFHRYAQEVLRDQRPVCFEEHYPQYDSWLEIRLHPFSEGLTSFFSDITGRKQSQEARQRSDDRLSLALKATEMGMWDWDLLQEQVSWSARMAEVFGDREGTFDGTYASVLALIHPEDQPRVREAVRQALSGEREYEAVHRTAEAGGAEPRWVMSRGRVYFDPAGRPVRMSGICLDVTDRMRMEQRLRQSQKMEAIGRLAGGVAHDFNNMLGVIGGYATLLMQRAAETEGSEETEAILQEIRQAAERASDLTRQLLAFSRQQVLQPRIVELNQEVAAMSRMLRRLIGEHIRLETRLAPALGCIKVDPGQLQQVVLNLVVNARDAMPNGGRLTVTTENTVSAPEEAGLEGERFVCLRVADTGCGMSPALLSCIFEPFFTTKGEGQGTGLGLSTVYGIVNQSGGAIRVRSEVGVGSTFEIYFPVCNEAPRAPAREEAPPSQGSETILLVEDEQMLRHLIRDALKAYGYHVLEAESGEAALALCGDGAPRIDLLLTDVVMPGMSGAALAREFRRLHPSAHILYMTGYTDDAIVHHGVRNEGAPLLQKPFTIKTLAHRLREVLQNPVTSEG